MSNGWKREESMANVFEELGGLRWADVRFDATVRPQELQLPLMLPAGYFCHSVQRLQGKAPYVGFMSLIEVKSCKWKAIEWSETTNNNIRRQPL